MSISVQRRLQVFGQTVRSVQAVVCSVANCFGCEYKSFLCRSFQLLNTFQRSRRTNCRTKNICQSANVVWARYLQVLTCLKPKRPLRVLSHEAGAGGCLTSLDSCLTNPRTQIPCRVRAASTTAVQCRCRPLPCPTDKTRHFPGCKHSTHPDKQSGWSRQS